MSRRHIVNACALVALLAGSSVSCGSQECTRSRYPQDFAPEDREFYSQFGYQDGTEVVTCTLGSYTVGMVAHQDSQSITVFRDREPLFSGGPQGRSVFGHGGSSATFALSSSDAQPGSFSYQSTEAGTRIMVVDSDLDGQPEMRMRTHPDKTTEREYWYQDRWQKMVTQGGISGLMVNGEFLSLPKLREALRSPTPGDIAQ